MTRRQRAVIRLALRLALRLYRQGRIDQSCCYHMVACSYVGDFSPLHMV